MDSQRFVGYAHPRLRRGAGMTLVCYTNYMHIYFCGIGGAGLGPLAEVAQDAGFKVSGSDLKESLVSLELEKRGVDVVYEQTTGSIAAEHAVNPIDWFVYTSALADNHPELQFARANNIRVSKRDEFLAEFLRERNLELIAIAGTHGKTTTTGMMIWAALELKLPISYSIGTTISFGPSGKFDPTAKYFIYECDEYDRNFLHFYPKIAILPSVDYDHADIFPTVDDYKSAFRQFIDQSDQAIMFKNTFDYLQPLGNDDLLVIDHQTSYEEIKLAGQARRDDAYLVAQALKLINDYDESEINKILGKFPGTNRRFEQLVPGLISDYAHHPTEIAATIEAAREVNPNIIAIYEPHQNMRQHELRDQYRDVFIGAKHIYWLPTFIPPGDRESLRHSGLDPESSDKLDSPIKSANDKILTPQDLISKLKNPEIAEPAKMNDDLWTTIQTHIATGDLVVAMSAGDLDAWLRERTRE